jgi:hypothetical protein
MGGTVGARRRRAGRGITGVYARFISFRPLPICETPKIANKVENLQKQKL